MCKTNKNHKKNQDFQTNTWNLQPIVWKSWFFGFYWFCPCFLLLGKENIGKPNVFARAPSQNIGKTNVFASAPSQNIGLTNVFQP